MLTTITSSILILLPLLQSIPKAQIASQIELNARDMTLYKKLGPFVITPLTRGNNSVEAAEAKVRQFVWNQWRERRRAYASLTIINIEGEPNTASFFVEPDAKGRWLMFMMQERYEVGRGGFAYSHYEVFRYFAYQVERIVPPMGENDRVEIKNQEKEPDPSAYRLRLKDKEGRELSVF